MQNAGMSQSPSFEDKPLHPVQGGPVPDDDLMAACKEVARTVLWRQGETSADVVETQAHRYYQIACQHQNYIRQNCDTDDVIANAVRYIARVHAIPPSGTDTVWFSLALEVLLELAVPNTVLEDEESARFLSNVQQGIVRAMGTVKVSRDEVRIDDESASTLSKLVDAGCEHQVAFDVFNLVDRLYHGEQLDEHDRKFLRLVAMAAPLTRRKRLDDGIDDQLLGPLAKPARPQHPS